MVQAHHHTLRHEALALTCRLGRLVMPRSPGLCRGHGSHCKFSGAQKCFSSPPRHACIFCFPLHARTSRETPPTPALESCEDDSDASPDNTQAATEPPPGLCTQVPVLVLDFSDTEDDYPAITPVAPSFTADLRHGLESPVGGHETGAGLFRGLSGSPDLQDLHRLPPPPAPLLAESKAFAIIQNGFSTGLACKAQKTDQWHSTSRTVLLLSRCLHFCP